MPRPSVTWLITDTHFFHDAMVELCGRPPNFTELIIKNWKLLVQPQDEVIHLGDVIFYQLPRLKGILDSLPGRKALVMGNHDHRNKTRSWYMRNGFDWVAESMIIGDILLNHKPVPYLPDGVRLCIHGHLHNRKESEQGVGHNRLLAIEHTNYKPVRFVEFSR